MQKVSMIDMVCNKDKHCTDYMKCTYLKCVGFNDGLRREQNKKLK